jgi:non-specific serine/threonine protein kinase
VSFKVEPDVITSNLPPLPTLPSIPLPNNLPENPELLVGREKEIAEIRNSLLQTNVRLLTLTGVGGAGKTRLALAVAQDLLPDFPDGVFFIELAAVTSAEYVASAIAQPLGVKEAGGKPILEILKDYLGDKKMLLVLDNFEQVTDAAPQIRELLNASRLKMLITSQTLLRLTAEREFVVPPLAVPSEIRELSLETVANYEAVKLFVQRAQKAKPGFVLTEENAQSVAEICARLDGLPLAIELAAARVKILAPQANLTKLENRLKLLTGGARDLPARQQTIRGAVAWSYGLLNEDEKKLFRRLAAFAGGFTFETAEAVCGGDEPHEEVIDFLDLLTSLVDKSLLMAKEQSDGAETRFRMLEVVREYALESLESSGEANDVRRRHAAYFLALGEEAEPHLQAVHGADWLKRLGEEHDNLRATLRGSLENDPETAARLAGSLRTFWIFHGHFAEGRQWLEKVLGSNYEIPLNTQWKILYGAGLITELQGDYNSGHIFLEQSRDAAALAGDRQKVAISGTQLATTLCELGNLREAKALAEESLAIGKELNDKYVIARSLMTAGELARSEDDYQAARRFYEEALEFYEQIDMKNGVVGTFINLGAVSYVQGDFKMSRSYFEKGLKISQEVGLKVLMILCLEGFAALAAQQDELERAARVSGAAEVLLESMGFVSEREDRRFRDTYLAELKAKMDEADFSKFYEQGRKMKLEEILAFVQNQP